MSSLLHSLLRACTYALQAMEAANKEIDPLDEEAKGGSGEVGKMLLSSGFFNLSLPLVSLSSLFSLSLSPPSRPPPARPSLPLSLLPLSLARAVVARGAHTRSHVRHWRQPNPQTLRPNPFTPTPNARLKTPQHNIRYPSPQGAGVCSMPACGCAGS